MYPTISTAVSSIRKRLVPGSSCLFRFSVTFDVMCTYSERMCRFAIRYAEWTRGTARRPSDHRLRVVMIISYDRHQER